MSAPTPERQCQKALLQIAALIQQKQHKQALQSLQQLRGCEQSPMYWQLASEALLGTQRPIDARNAIRRGLKLDPDNLNSKMALAQCELKLEHESKAAEILREVLAEKPDHWHATHQLLTALSRLGDMEAARQLIRQGLKHFPDDAALLFQATVLKMFDLPQLEITHVETLLQKKLPAHDRFTLLFVLSRLQAKAQDFAKAAESLKEANRLKRQQVARKIQLIQSTRTVIEDFTRERIEPLLQAGHPSDCPIFIVGMPRSGTTLTEQILNQHPQVVGVGERNVMGALIGQQIRQLPAGGSVMEQLARKPKIWKEMGEDYLAFVRKMIGKAPHSADKMPLNANMVGFIRLIFPNARIIHCRRDPYDTLLSCLQAHFNEERLVFSPEEWGQVYASYEALMKHWDRLFPGSIIHLDYEQLVSQPEETIPALLEQLQLPFHADCLHPERSGATIRTASIAQVRSPINAGSVGRSRAWMPWLKEVEESLKQAREQLQDLFDEHA